jgi:zinc/manganese transport system substrate-binding protein
VRVLEAPSGPVDRGLGDLHPGGNPHFLTDPRRAEAVATAIAERLAALDPAGAAHYQDRLSDLRRRVAEARRRWEAALAPLRGGAVVTHHRTFSYFLDWAGLRSVGELEPRPGTPPPPSHVAALVERAKAEGVKAILIERWYDPRPAELLARQSGASVVVVPGDVGAEPAAKDWFAHQDLLVGRVVEALSR